jgi:SAM-dependent methyltransferase
MKKVQLLKNWEEDCSLMENYIKQKAIAGLPLQILEAGCGQYWPLNLKGIQFALTGVDLNKNVLNPRRVRSSDLSEMIVGDLRFLDLEKNRYDVIYNSYVLEHIDGADRVLENFSNWLKPGGVLILRIPDRNSVWGFVTRFTPFWFRMLHTKYIKGCRKAGTTGFGPFLTFHDPIVSRTGIREYCRKNHFVMKEERGHSFYLDGQGIIPFLIYLFVRTVSLLSLGKLAREYNDLTYILEKQ